MPTSVRTPRSAPTWSIEGAEIEHSIVLPEAELRLHRHPPRVERDRARRADRARIRAARSLRDGDRRRRRSRAALIRQRRLIPFPSASSAAAGPVAPVMIRPRALALCSSLRPLAAASGPARRNAPTRRVHAACRQPRRVRELVAGGGLRGRGRSTRPATTRSRATPRR